MLANNVNSFMMTWTSLLLGAQPVGSRSAGEAAPKAARIVPTNSLAFHLQSLGRSPSAEEREVIEAALALMVRYQIRTDSPLRSVWHDRKANEWLLHFENGDPNGTFTIFLRNSSSDWLELLHTMLASRRIRFPRDRRGR